MNYNEGVGFGKNPPINDDNHVGDTPYSEGVDHSEMLDLEKIKAETERLYQEYLKHDDVVEALTIVADNDAKYQLSYHNVEHTKDVIHETILFYVADHIDDNINIEELEEQVIAAAWHDAVFQAGNSDNEKKTVELFRNSVAYSKMNGGKRAEIEANILDTEAVTNFNNKHQRVSSTLRYILDADMSNVGRDDFFDKMKLIALEKQIDLDSAGTDRNLIIKYYNMVLKLLEHHVWYTKSANILRKNKKMQNMEELRSMIARLGPMDGNSPLSY